MLLRQATQQDKTVIWEILQQAIVQRRLDGSEQWQQGYPNEQSVQSDIEQGYGYVLIEAQQIVAFAAIIFGTEPSYEEIDGKWLTDGDYMVVHRVATSDQYKRKGVATLFFQMMEDLAQKHQVYSIKVDTNFDNLPMLHILDKLGYQYCGEIYFGGAPRKAFEKILPKE